MELLLLSDFNDNNDKEINTKIKTRNINVMEHFKIARMRVMF